MKKSVKRSWRSDFSSKTPKIVRENNIRIYNNLKKTDPVMAEIFRQKYLS
jgi:hypothetical protein